MQIVIDIRNNEVAHPPNTQPTDIEFEDCMTSIEAMLEQIGHLEHASNVRRLRDTALGRLVREAENSRQSRATSDDLPTWLSFVETFLSERRMHDSGWARLSDITEYVASAHPEFREEVGTHPQQLESDISRFSDTFEVTITDKSRRRNSPFARLIGHRPAPISALPDWASPLAEIVRRSSDSGRTTRNLRPKLKYAIEGFDEREYGYTTLADLVATRQDTFKLSHRKGGVVFVSLRNDERIDR